MRGFNEGRRGSLKLVARGEEACSAGPAASAALLAGARFNACAMRGRVRVRAITPSSPFLFGYNKISFSIHILQVKFVDKL